MRFVDRFANFIERPLPFFSVMSCLWLAALVGCRLNALSKTPPVIGVQSGAVAPVDGLLFQMPEAVSEGQPVPHDGFIVRRSDLASALRELVQEVPDAPFPSDPIEHTVYSEPVGTVIGPTDPAVEPVPDPRFTVPDGSGGWKRRAPQ